MLRPERDHQQVSYENIKESKIYVIYDYIRVFSAKSQIYVIHLYLLTVFDLLFLAANISFSY
jgi:hypothetical protein